MGRRTGNEMVPRGNEDVGILQEVLVEEEEISQLLPVEGEYLKMGWHFGVLCTHMEPERKILCQMKEKNAN